MKYLKQYWPTAYSVQKGNIISLVVQLVIFILICAVIGWVIGVLAGIPLIGVLSTVLGILLEIYGVVGIVVCVLRFLGIL